MTFELLEVSSDVLELVNGAVVHSLPDVEPPKPARSHDRPRVLPAPQITPAAAAPPVPAPLTATPVHAVAGSEMTSTEQPQAEPKLATSASAAPAVPPQASQVASRRPSGPSPEKDAYYRSLRAAVEQHRRYPRIARRAKTQGTVVVRMTVSRAGRLLAASVSRSSGEELLDVAALSAVRLAAPLPVAPAALESDPVTVDMPFVFRLR
jgi:periplasmic protein TonB